MCQLFSIVFRLFDLLLGFWTPNPKKTCLRFVIFNYNEKLQDILQSRLKNYGVIVQKSLYDF